MGRHFQNEMVVYMCVGNNYISQAAIEFEESVYLDESHLLIPPWEVAEIAQRLR